MSIKFNPFGAVALVVDSTVGWHPRLLKLSSFRALRLKVEMNKNATKWNYLNNRGCKPTEKNEGLQPSPEGVE